MASIITDIERYRVPKVEIDYYMVIGGAIPELGTMLSFRRIAQQHTRKLGRKIIRCPHCKEKLTETGANTKVEIFHKPISLAVSCQFHMKCNYCKKEIGLSIVHRA